MTQETSTAPPDHQSTNAVRLSGRVSAAPEARMLPSGDEVVSFRLVVPRSAAAKRRSKQSVDTIECSAWTARLRRAVRRLEAGDAVTVTGELRRRFTRGASGPMSWVNVDLETCERTAGTLADDD
ncbi:single-stranded DNA-binding protein [Aeromicrobium sp.]|uniref:single-stranded DNA-binding protein n=1 Tax=Aeromicrobium sp. TaxID=1871063 RepID=UPI003C43D6AF